jgi:hypothetical protein
MNTDAQVSRFAPTYAAGSTLGAPTPVAAVPAAIAGLDNGVSRLHDRIGLLEQRLAALTQPLPPAGVGEASKMARHSLALQIEANANSIQAAADRIDSIINRLEV